MSDLISRSELIKLINTKYIGLNDAVDLYHGGKFDCFKEIKLMIKKQPTAYDIDKVVEELEQKKEEVQRMRNTCVALSDLEVCDIENVTYERAIEIVKQEADQYNNGWIPCSERLPKGRQDVLVCFDNIDCCIIAWYSPNGRTWRNSSTNNICKEEPIAWMNLPAPYQTKGE